MNVFFTNEEVVRFSDSAIQEGSDPTPYTPEWFRRDGRPLCIYGSGVAGRGMYSFFGNLPGMEGRVIGFMDSDPAKCDQRISGLPILMPEDPAWRERRPLIVLAVNNPVILNTLESRCGVLGYDTVRFDRILLAREPALDAVFLENNLQALAGMELWDDSESRETYRRRIRLLCTRNPADIVYSHWNEQYFSPIISTEQYRFFVDGGAYNGDTFHRYMKRFGQVMGEYYLFEPDKRNRRQIEQSIGADPHVHVFEFALSDKRRLLRFHEDQDTSSSRLDAAGEVDVQAVSLDEILAGKQITFIKMDIEGAEPEALKGAVNILSSQHPTLAICLYHRPEHLWEIPLWLRRTMPSYRLFLRHYSMTQYETVCYAIPGKPRTP